MTQDSFSDSALSVVHWDVELAGYRALARYAKVKTATCALAVASPNASLLRYAGCWVDRGRSIAACDWHCVMDRAAGIVPGRWTRSWMTRRAAYCPSLRRFTRRCSS
jgi:hypothetical protein